MAVWELQSMILKKKNHDLDNRRKIILFS